MKNESYNSTPDGRDERPADLSCENARSLIPGYLDGELTEAQAAPLRKHLFACPTCREVTKDEKSLKKWFSEALPETVDVPQGFAARVARRAFAGDPGLLVPVPARAASVEEHPSLLPFLLKLTAVAAGLLLVFAVTIQRRSLPSGDGLSATDLAPWDRESASESLVDRPAMEIPAKEEELPEADDDSGE